MRLQRVEVIGFRGIAALTLDCGRDTVLIGENNWGKSSLFDAIDIALGSRGGEDYRFGLGDFHDPGLAGAPLRELSITLHFREHEAGDWAAPVFAGLQPVVFRRGRYAYCTLQLRASLDAGPVDGDETAGLRAWRLFLDADGQEIHTDRLYDCLEELAALRPVFRLRSLLGPPSLDGWACPVDRDDPERNELEARIGAVYRQLVTSPHQVQRQELIAAQAAVSEVLAGYLQRLPQDRGGARGVRRARDIVRAPLDLQLLEGLRDVARYRGDGMRGVLLLALLGAVLAARGCRPVREGAWPLLLIEEPEAQLHPVALATAWGLMASLPGEKIISTNSGQLLGSFPIGAIRRMVRHAAGVEVFRLGEQRLSEADRRRLAFHLRVHRPQALFARAWLLVEGETEFWLLPSLARVCGHHFQVEGVACVEFAQSGLDLLIACAQELGIPWHLVTDGDRAGHHYAAQARRLLRDGEAAGEHITVFGERDIEHFLWSAGYAGCFLRAAGLPPDADRARQQGRRGVNASHVIRRAIKNATKPQLALEVAEEAGHRGVEAVPEELRSVFDLIVRRARASVAW